MRTIYGITFAYVVAIAVTMGHLSDTDAKASGMAVGEAMFATPMIVACLLALVIRREKSRRVFLIFQIVFSVLTLLVFALTFSGEPDGQYQLALLLIPLIGFPSVLCASVIAALAGKQAQGD